MSTPISPPEYLGFPSCTICAVNYLGDGTCGACLYVRRLRDTLAAITGACEKQQAGLGAIDSAPVRRARNELNYHPERGSE